MRILIAVFAIILLYSCTKNQESQNLSLKRIQFEKFGFIEIGCPPQYLYYLTYIDDSDSKKNKRLLFVNKLDTFKVYSHHNITYDISYKKLSEEPCEDGFGNKFLYDKIELMSVSRSK
jgi:hypothetical protein